MSRNNPVVFIFVLTFSRLISNMTRRFAYPFASQIAAQLAVPVEAVQNMIALQSGVGITSPIFGPLSERYGRKWVMVGGLLAMAAVSVLGALVPRFWVFAVLMIAFGVAKMIFDPALLAYVGDRIPYNRRAMAIGTTELSWAGSLFVIAPVAGFLLEGGYGVQAVFAFFAVTEAAAAAVLWFLLPADRPENHEIKIVMPLDAWRILRGSPIALAALGYSFFLVTANELMFINYSPWMESSFDIPANELGIITTVIAAAEVIGEFGVIGIADRFGKRRMALVAALLAALLYVVLPYLAFSLPATMIGLFLIFLSVETAIVASLPMFTEILPNSRAVMMSSNASLHSLGRLLGASAGSLLLRQTGSFNVVCLIATVVGLLAFVMMWRFVHETPHAA